MANLIYHSGVIKAALETKHLYQSVSYGIEVLSDNIKVSQKFRAHQRLAKSKHAVEARTNLSATKSSLNSSIIRHIHLLLPLPPLGFYFSF